VSEEGFIHVDLGPELKAKFLAVLERQATTQKLAVRRIIETFVESDDNAQALWLKQVHGEGAKALARHLLARMAKGAKGG
jgi:hypothetical protein